MKKLFVFISLAALGLAACKKGTTVNVYTGSMPSFIVSGVQNMTFTNGAYYSTQTMSLTVQYEDSTQQMVTLALSALPAGIAIDTQWQTSGYPTFSTGIEFYDTTTAGATPGTYPMTLTATTASGQKKTFSFTIKVNPEPPCTSIFTGKYVNCYNTCVGTGSYTDSIYADPNVVNKVWFTNFANSGHAVYGQYSCSTEELTIPLQTVGSITYSGSAFISTHSFSISVVKNGTTSCTIEEE
jgi:hypothetical protein